MVTIIFVFIVGIIFMKKATSILEVEKFKKLSYTDKVEVTSNIKSNWKLSILLLSVLVCELLVLISFFIGKTTFSYENTVNISIIIINVIILILLYLNNIKIEKYFKNINLK